jgi:hypothetical protein
MQIDKSQILELLRSQGKNDEASQADGELPDQVDTDQHGGMLSKYGIDVGDLLSRFGGGGLGAVSEACSAGADLPGTSRRAGSVRP